MKRRLSIIFAIAAMLPLAFACSSKGSTDPDPTPAETLDAPTGVAAKDIAEDALTFTWNSVSGASAYSYKLMKGMTLVKDGNQSGCSITFNGLEADTEYTFAVKSVKGDVQSKYSDYVSAKTLSSSGGDTPGPDPLENLYESMKIPAAEEDGVVRAFPGAEGGGMFTTGGRGGKILHVTSLADTGAEGTLRWAVKQDGARTIVFDVAGIIHLTSPLKIEKANCTIAGQTAPGDGICIADRYCQIAADNVIIRFIRFRLGDQGTGAGDSDDAIWGRYCNNIIIDHCSMSWSIDECASFYSNTDFTMQWCIIAESMKNCSIHTKGNHGYGGIWGGENASFHHNILAHHDSRNPRFDHPHIYENHTSPAHRGVVDFRNNVVYDWGSNSSYGGEGYGAGKGTGINMIGNYYKPGPGSTDRKYFMDSYGVYSSCSECGKNIEDGYPLLYMDGNVHSKYSDISSENSKGIYWHNGEDHTNYGKTSASEFGMKDCSTTTHSAKAALDATCTYAGASLTRDNVDDRITSDVKNGTGNIMDDIAAIEKAYGSSWPKYSADEDQTKHASVDTDGDGIPDWYEGLFGLNAKDASDGAAISIDKNKRYSNFEMYLHYLVRDIMSNENEGGEYKKM